MTSFRFSPNPNQAAQIDWQPWGGDAFSKAQAENKPVLLSVSAVWCYWCHVMDETTYSDPGVAKFLNGHYIAVRVDSDQRPDINARYNVGGWPTTAFLTGHGGIIGGATYLPPDQFLAMMAEIHQAYAEDRPRLYEQAREMHRHRRDMAGRGAAGPEVEEALVDQVSRVVAGAYDVSNGGFGNQPKFPSYPVVQLVSHLARTTGEEFYRVMLKKTLDRMADSPLHDKTEGGFFRHCAGSDWSEPQWEKLLEDNVGLAQVYLDAGFLLDRDDYCQAASRTIDYIMEHLFDSAVPGFHGSQGAHSEYFSQTLESRREQSSPPVDPSCYTSGNAQAIALLLDAAWRLERPELAETALQVLDAIASKVQIEDVGHVFDQSAMHLPPGFLLDWSQLVNAHLSAYAFTNREIYLDRASTLANDMLDRFFDQQNGGFFDIEQDDSAIGHLEIREKPLPDNAAAALALLKLHQMTGNDDYRQVAETTLSAFVQTYREYGEFAAPYGLAVHRLKHSPVEVTVEGRHGDPGTVAMLKASYQLTCPHLEVKPIQTQDTGIPAQAHVCLDTLCLPPVSDPGQLAEAVANMSGTGPFGASPFSDSPFENIFEKFPGI
ncbi:MAG: hypothetical protein BZY80_03505 [SAR202 cluster bacterium Io17-Chloro-G2]|nr:MAG: hypothetical protein BZY80_03505 [SAR202 cluster bacterium Io17-Chloro-G2]